MILELRGDRNDGQHIEEPVKIKEVEIDWPPYTRTIGLPLRTYEFCVAYAYQQNHRST